MVLGVDDKVEVVWDGAKPCRVDGVVQEVFGGRGGGSEAVVRAMVV